MFETRALAFMQQEFAAAMNRTALHQRRNVEDVSTPVLYRLVAMERFNARAIPGERDKYTEFRAKEPDNIDKLRGFLDPRAGFACVCINDNDQAARKELGADAYGKKLRELDDVMRDAFLQPSSFERGGAPIVPITRRNALMRHEKLLISAVTMLLAVVVLVGSNVLRRRNDAHDDDAKRI